MIWITKWAHFFVVLQDKVGSWYSNPGTGATDSIAVGGGVGKYLKAKSSQTVAVTADSGFEDNGAPKKRKVGASAVEYKNFSAW